jgi:hypothetical protein
MVTMSPNLMGFLNETLFTADVTQMRRLHRCALMAALMSIQLSKLPPIKFPKVLVSLGMTIRVLEAYVSFGVRWVTMSFKLSEAKFRRFCRTSALQLEENSEENKKAPPTLEGLSQ